MWEAVKEYTVWERTQAGKRGFQKSEVSQEYKTKE